MSEYRPGVTSPHTLSQRGLPLPPLSLSFPPHPTYPISALLLTPSSAPSYALEHSYYLAAYLQRGAPLPVSPPRSLACSLDFSLSRPALLSTSSSSLIILVLPVCVVLLVLCLRFFPPVVHFRGLLLDSSFFAIPSRPPKYFRGVSAISFTPFCSD